MRRAALATAALLLLGACASAPLSTPRADAFVGSALQALQQGRIRPEEPGRTTPLFENADHTVNLIQVNAFLSTHFHKEHDETVYILEGEGTFTIDGQAREVKAGDLLVIPRLAVHGFKNKGPAPAAAISIFTPRFDTADRYAPTQTPERK